MIQAWKLLNKTKYVLSLLYNIFIDNLDVVFKFRSLWLRLEQNGQWELASHYSAHCSRSQVHTSLLIGWLSPAVCVASQTHVCCSTPCVNVSLTLSPTALPGSLLCLEVCPVCRWTDTRKEALPRSWKWTLAGWKGPSRVLRTQRIIEGVCVWDYSFGLVDSSSHEQKHCWKTRLSLIKHRAQSSQPSCLDLWLVYKVGPLEENVSLRK